MNKAEILESHRMKNMKGGSMKIKFELDTVSQEIVVNGVKYTPETAITFPRGEVVTITEVRAEYRLGSTWLCLCFEMPKMKFNPGDRIRISKE